jgi:bifunctional NMN adenylyltransferase/nudix hydrolase
MGRPWADIETRYDVAVVIGRFQPLHYGQIYKIDKGLQEAKRVLVLVGSAFSSSSPKNPFTYDEREKMILDHYRNSKDRDRVFVEPLGDNTYEHNQWLTDVQEIVDSYASRNVVLIGHEKDSSSYYLKDFPQWEFQETGRWPTKLNTIDATQIRDLYYKHDLRFVSGVVPATVYNFLEWYSTNERYKWLVDYNNFVIDYKKPYDNLPYAATHNTVDAVVVQSGHILLIKRKVHPGKDQYAMPGGFIQEQETLEQAVLRELREETKLKVPVPVLRGSITKNQVFDSPSRSLRGRTITQAYLFQLKNEEKLPKVKGSDDAKEAKWFTLTEFYDMEHIMYEDHFHIIKKMIDNT